MASTSISNLGPRSICSVALAFVVICTFFLFDHDASKPRFEGYSTRLRRDNLMDVTNRTLGFEEVMVISMPDRFDKRDVWSLAAAITGMDITYVDGVRGEDVTPKAIPAGWNTRAGNGTLGSFRAHMNAVRRIIENGLSSALIFEDDVDWDVMLKAQLIEFARGSRFLQDVQDPGSLHSPYGDDWDLLWLGYCGTRSRPDRDGRYYAAKDDPTVLPPSIRIPQDTNRFVVVTPPELQGNHTRIVYEPRDTRCSYAYALSQKGAQKFLYNFAIRPMARLYDRCLSDFCDPIRMPNSKCIAPFPSLIDTYLAPGSTAKDSDRVAINHAYFRMEGVSPFVVFPVKAGFETFIQGHNNYKSSNGNVTMLPEIDPQTYQLPRGQGLFFTANQFEIPDPYP